MSVSSRITWTCDRCGTSEHKDNTAGWQPDDWATLSEFVPPKAANEKRDDLGIICRPCRSALRDWFRESEVES